LKQIADDAVVRELKNGRIRIPIDRHDHVRVAHPYRMLNGAGYANREIQLGPDCRPGLPYLMLMLDPPGINGCTLSTDFAPEGVGQFLQHSEWLRPA
jgi:hypothetical protein